MRRRYCSPGCRCFSAPRRSRRSRQSLPAPKSRRSRWAICCCRWSRNPWCMRIRPAVSFATACSNRPATMRPKSSPMLRACAGGTPSTSPRGSHKRRRSGRRPPRGSGWHAMPATSTTCAARCHVLWAELGLILEHRRWVVEALDKVAKGTPPEVTARLLSWQSGDVRELDDPADYDEAVRAASLYRKAGDGFQEGRVLLRAGTARLLPDSVDEGERLLRKAHALVRPFGTTKTLAR